MCRAERGGVEARRLDVDDHEVPCGVHFFRIAACTDKKAESVGAQRFTVPTTNIGQRQAARQTVRGVALRISGLVNLVIKRDTASRVPTQIRVSRPSATRLPAQTPIRRPAYAH